MDWPGIFAFSIPPLETLVRGTVMYWLLFLLFRFVVRRDVGSMGIADILLIVIVADAAQNGMAGDGKSVTDAALLVITLVAWNMALDRLAFHFPPVRRFVDPEARTELFAVAGRSNVVELTGAPTPNGSRSLRTRSRTAG